MTGRPTRPIGIRSLTLLGGSLLGLAALLGSRAPGGNLSAPRPATAAEAFASDASPDGASRPEDGKDPRSASAIPLPPVLPTPRIDLPVSPDGGSPAPEGWSLKEFAGKPRLKVEKIGPLYAVHLSSDRASFSLYKDITVDVTQYPYLTWAWRVDQLPPKGDVRRRETDDQAAQLYVVFPRFPAMVRSQIIGYVWDSTAPAGTVLTSPSNRMAKIIVLRSGTESLGRWVVETRNVQEDFRHLFGEAPPKVGKVSLLINSQNTKSTAESWFAGLVFTRSPILHDTGMAADAAPFRAERDLGPGRQDRVN